MELRPTTPNDLEFVLAAEADPDAAPFIERWAREEHERAIDDPDQAHWMVSGPSGPAGFVLLAGLASPNRAIELRRIVVSEPGRRLGRTALALVLEHAFTLLEAHRVWLDVMVHNERARRAYRAVGFVEEGVLRDALLGDRGYESLVVMSILAHEWRAKDVTAVGSP